MSETSVALRRDFPTPLRDHDFAIPRVVDEILFEIADPTLNESIHEVCIVHGVEPGYVADVLATRKGIARRNKYAMHHLQASFPLWARRLHEKIQNGDMRAIELYARVVGVDKLRVDIHGPEMGLDALEARIKGILDYVNKASPVQEPPAVEAEFSQEVSDVAE